MADISLTASMRTNLLSLQNTQSLMDMTQERLSSGLKVNSAIDNASSYYTAQSLNNRASDLSALLDNMGQGIQTIKAANEGIEAITAFVEQAKAIANSARDVPSSLDKSQMKSATSAADKFAAGDTVAKAQSFLVDSRVDMSSATVTAAAGSTAKDSVFDLYVNGEKHTITVPKDASTALNEKEVATSIKAQVEALGLGLKVELDSAVDGKFTISSAKGDSVSLVNEGGSDQPALAAGGDIATIKTVAAGATVAGVISGLSEAGKTSVAYEDGVFTLSNESTSKQTAVYNITAAVDKDSKLSFNGILEAKPSATNTERKSYAAQFDAIRSQIDQLAKDAGYKGINLLQQNDLKVVFNEDRSSSIAVEGVKADSKGMGINAATGDWQSDNDIDSAISSVESAITQLRSWASDFGNYYSIVQNRQDFTKNLVNVLTEGADSLTLADMNEESANMLALQTRQQLAINSLSLASQAAQSVLQLF